MEPKQVTLLWGLPGSGKTTYANSLVYPNGKKKPKIYLVTEEKVRSKPANFPAAVARQCMVALEKNDHAVVDSLITTNDLASKVIEAIKSKYFGELEFNIVWWEENREQCILNDKFRNRDTLAKKTIDNLPLEEPAPSLDGVKSIIKLQVKSPPAALQWVRGLSDQIYEKFQIDFPSSFNSPVFLIGEEWSLGGECFNYSGDSWTEGPEEEAEFTILENFLEQVAPKISFLEFKRIQRECVTQEEKGSCDYYSNVRYAYWRADLLAMYPLLKEMGYID